ncbi:hypothetical protein [Helicobacter pylori]|uniref:hypothetical protein n=1 Tax=Helicobacter pylori TaxID=210 RepID=UPI0036F3DE2C
MTINTHYTPNFTQLQTLNNINNAPNAPDFDRLQALNAINNDGEIKDRSQVDKNLADGENTPEIYSSLDTYA